MILEWLKKNLFRTAADSVLTLVAGSGMLYALYRLLRFVFITGRWTVIKSNLNLLTTGAWPQEELWRLTTVILAFAAMAGVFVGLTAKQNALEAADEDVEVLTTGEKVRSLIGRLWPAAGTVLLLLLLTETAGPWILTAGVVIIAVVGWFVGQQLPLKAKGMLSGGGVVLFAVLIWFLTLGVSWNSWGGMVLNLFLAAISIVLCFPFGVLLALGRRSEYPIIRGVCTAYVELFRGVPLLGLLLMANVALGFFIPRGLVPGNVVKAIVVFTLFSAAYVAEIVRGGLQSVPRGQLEAGRAMGMSPITVTRKIILPQALRNVIPSLVGQFISLFKDTTLAGAALGMTDLLTGAQVLTAQKEFRGQGLIAETLIFVLLLFWAGSFTMSQESQRLESRLGIGER